MDSNPTIVVNHPCRGCCMEFDNVEDAERHEAHRGHSVWVVLTNSNVAPLRRMTRSNQPRPFGLVQAKALP